MVIIKISDDWEQLLDDDIVVAESHHLNVEDVLRGLRIPYGLEYEEDIDDEF